MKTFMQYIKETQDYGGGHYQSDKDLLADKDEKPWLLIKLTPTQFFEMEAIFSAMTLEGEKLRWHNGLAIRKGMAEHVVDAIKSSYGLYGIEAHPSVSRSMLNLADKIESEAKAKSKEDEEEFLGDRPRTTTYEAIRENQEMSDDDYKITPSGHLGGKVSVSDNFGRPKEFQDVEDALDFIRKDMEKNHFWPNIWWVSDHGNSWMIDLEGKEIKETASFYELNRRMDEDTLENMHPGLVAYPVVDQPIKGDKFPTEDERKKRRAGLAVPYQLSDQDWIDHDRYYASVAHLEPDRTPTAKTPLPMGVREKLSAATSGASQAAERTHWLRQQAINRGMNPQIVDKLSPDQLASIADLSDKDYEAFRKKTGW